MLWFPRALPLTKIAVAAVFPIFVFTRICMSLLFTDVTLQLNNLLYFDVPWCIEGMRYGPLFSIFWEPLLSPSYKMHCSL
jgi:hypothetical protein